MSFRIRNCGGASIPPCHAQLEAMLGLSTALLRADCQGLIHWREALITNRGAVKSFMSNQNSKRVIAGVSLERHVMVYLDDLAGRMGMSRSWVLNTIVYEYARLIEKRNLTPLGFSLTAPMSKEPVIKL
jgi:hypothetical protein